MSRVVKPENLTSKDIVRVKMDEDNLMSMHKVKIGYSAEKGLNSLTHKEEVSDKDALGLRSDLKSGLAKMITQIQEKSPLKYKIVKGASCLNPKLLADENEKDNVQNNFDVLISEYEKAGRLSGEECDRARTQFSRFQDLATAKKVRQEIRPIGLVFPQSCKRK